VRPAASNGASGNKANFLRPELQQFHNHPRFHVVAADLAEPGLSLTPDGKAMLPDEFDVTFHFAAATEFRESKRESTFRVNVDGTRNLIDFLQTLRRSGRLYHISTAYVCWQKHVGDFLYEELHRPVSEGCCYSNPYEESKHIAEGLVANSGLDWVILRPSILTGDSKTGASSSSKMVYGMFTSLWRFREVLRNKYGGVDTTSLLGQNFAVAAFGHVRINCIAVDDVVRLLCMVYDRSPPPRSILHLVNPRTIRIDTLAQIMYDLLGLSCLYFDMSTECIKAEEQLLSRGFRVYEPYILNKHPLFDQSRLRLLLGDSAVETIVVHDECHVRSLLATYLHEQLEVSVCPASTFGAAAVPYDRLSAVLFWGRGPIALNALEPFVHAHPLPGDNRGFLPCVLRYGRTAILLGDPIVTRSDFPVAAAIFLSWCKEEKLDPVALQIGQVMADLLAGHGGCSMKFGEHASISLPEWDSSLKGKKYRTLRARRYSALRGNITVREAKYDEIPFDEAKRVSDAWLATKINKRELSLLTRTLPATDEPGVRKFFAFQNDQVVGILVCNPSYEDGQLIGYVSDIERYAPQPAGIHQMLLLEAARIFQAEGLLTFSLGLAPLHRIEFDDHPSSSPQLHKLLRSMRDDTEPLYNFRGVTQFKRNFVPTWEPAYCYVQNPRNGSAVLDVLSLIGLSPPEALLATSDETFDVLVAG
jgi:nucleoside-diphosphate-sugar epimerase